jgi:hypothetical protein
VSLHNVGDAPRVNYHLVDPSTVPPTEIDGTVTATVAFNGAAAASLPVTHASLGRYYVTPTLPTEGDYVVTITTTAPINDVATYALAALPAGELSPAWAPALDDVAAHIPSRTREVGTDNLYTETFTADTTPTSDTVSILIGKACAWVASQAGLPVVTAAYPACAVAASLWAAYWVEIGFPERDGDVAVYDRLRKDAEAATKNAATVNLAAGGGAQLPSTDPTAGMAPKGTFPDAPSWADQSFHF